MLDAEEHRINKIQSLPSRNILSTAEKDTRVIATQSDLASLEIYMGHWMAEKRTLNTVGSLSEMVDIGEDFTGDCFSLINLLF